MDQDHRYYFAALSVIGFSSDSWTCQAIDGIANNNKWDNVTGYKHTNPTDAIENFNGPYFMTFTVTDDGNPLTLTATVSLKSDTPTLTKADGTELTLPSNGKPQVDPGLDNNLGSHVWFRYEDSGNLRELRFDTPLNWKEAQKLITEAAEWLIQHVHV